MARFVEMAIGSPSRRGTLVPYDDMWDIVYETGGNQAIYRSVYIYDEEGLDFVHKNRTVKSFLGTRYIDEIPIDIDKGDNTDEYTHNMAKDILRFCEHEFNLKDGNYQCYFSGTGYHIMLAGDNFNFKADAELPYVVKQTMMTCFDQFQLDPSVYSRTAIIRMAHTLNIKSQLFKIPISRDELLNGTYTDIQKLAAGRRTEYMGTELWGDGNMEHEIETHIPEVKAMGKVNENQTVVPCIQTIYNRGPERGNRNHSIMRVASHMRRHGIPSDATKAALLHWNNNQLNPQIVIDKVESTYNYGYKYGCQDQLLKSVCSPKCVYYKNKDYLVDVKTASTLQMDLEERLNTDFSGRSIDLAKMFGLEGKDCVVYPGELVTIFGPTGANKTTLAQNIACGYDFGQNLINKNWQLPTLFLSLELSGWYMHRRNLQIVSGMTKDQVSSDSKNVGKMYGHLLQHMQMQTISPSPDLIQKQVRELQPRLVVVDYIDLVETPPHIRGEYEQIKYISHYLSNLAVNMDIIIIQISQVSREYSRNQILDIYAGKGSGAIENASRKVLGINGKQDSSEKTVELFKNSDGDLFTVDLNWTPSFRLPRRYE
tara:strand:+ start:2754 stop:4544 length:1791 start_codon:yes stop_codon:yes gene_type:complete